MSVTPQVRAYVLLPRPLCADDSVFFDGGVVKKVVRLYNWAESRRKACSQKMLVVNWRFRQL